jgi:single-strand DNA-binding protein
MDINKIILLGRLGNNPDVRSLSSGTDICNLSVATETYIAKTKSTQTAWHKIVIFDTAIIEYCQKNFSKGDMVYIEGKLNYRTISNDEIIASGMKPPQICEIIISKFDGCIKLFKRKKEGTEFNSNNDVNEVEDQTEDDQIPF